MKLQKYYVLQNIAYILFESIANTVQLNNTFNSNNISYQNITTDCKIVIFTDNLLQIKNCVFENKDKFMLQLDSYIHLSSKDLTSLQVNDAKLPSILEVICKSKNLKFLDLSNNLITRLNSKCFETLGSLEALILDNNLITYLQDGVFNSLHRLKNLSINYNMINDIGLQVFSNMKFLSNINDISIANNKLCSVDSWPLMRAFNQNNTKISLNNNTISKFTNKLHYKYPCFKSYLYMEIDLQFNMISHYLDFTNSTSNPLSNLICLLDSRSKSHIVLKLGYNPIICDCTEYKFLKMYHLFKHYNDPQLDHIHCVAPASLQGQTYVQVSLDDLVCDIKCMIGCRCFRQPSNNTIHILCSNNNITILPTTLPPTNSTATYKLDFSYNNFIILKNNSYLYNKTVWLDLSNCELKQISETLWTSIMNIKYLYLASNQLRILPTTIIKNPGSFQFLNIENNSLSCECSDKWFQAWIKNNSKRITNSDGLLCSSPDWLKGKSLLKVLDEEFCTNPNEHYSSQIKIFIWITAAIASVIVSILVSLGFVYYKRVWFHAKFNFHPFGEDEYDDDVEMRNDIFISAAAFDRITATAFMYRLEERGYKVLYHERDFVPGPLIDENIADAINFSRRTLFIISPAFLASSYCLTEFEPAFARDLIRKKTGIIVLLMNRIEELRHYEDFNEVLRSYLERYTYIDYARKGDETAMQELMYAMPLRPMKALVVSEELEMQSSANKTKL